MTRLPLRNKAINLDTVTYAENNEWRESGDPRSRRITGVVIHFIGGSVLRLPEPEATEVRPYLGLPIA
jgi:hypothetical protein